MPPFCKYGARYRREVGGGTAAEQAAIKVLLEVSPKRICWHLASGISMPHGLARSVLLRCIRRGSPVAAAADREETVLDL